MSTMPSSPPPPPAMLRQSAGVSAKEYNPFDSDDDDAIEYCNMDAPSQTVVLPITTDSSSNKPPPKPAKKVSLTSTGTHSLNCSLAHLLIIC